MRVCCCIALCLTVLSLYSEAQVVTPIDGLYAAQELFCKKAKNIDEKSAFLEALTNDAVVFRPGAMNGLAYWQGAAPDETTVDRDLKFADVSSNGLLGYTTGSWKSTQKKAGKMVEHSGEYVSIWERRNLEGFRSVLDITTRHDDLVGAVSSGGGAVSNDPNSRGWSATNDAMAFLRTSMQGGGLAAALSAASMDDVRLLIDDEPPVVGRKNAVEAARIYTSMGFPENVAIYQSGDMAYFWNQCRFQNSAEGTERGNCLQIMKLRNKKWWIVLAVFSRLDDAKPPVLTAGSHRK